MAVAGLDDAVAGGLQPAAEDSTHRSAVVGDKDERRCAAVWVRLHRAEL
jgi:hypothetical protein